MHITYELGYGTTQYRSYQRPRIERKTVTGAILRGVGIGLAGVFSGAVTGRPEAFLYGVEIGLVAGTLNTTVAIISPMVEWWGEHLPDRALGGYGAVMVLIGSALQTLQYVMPLAGK